MKVGFIGPYHKQATNRFWEMEGGTVFSFILTGEPPRPQWIIVMATQIILVKYKTRPKVINMQARTLKSHPYESGGRE